MPTLFRQLFVPISPISPLTTSTSSVRTNSSPKTSTWTQNKYNNNFNMVNVADVVTGATRAWEVLPDGQKQQLKDGVRDLFKGGSGGGSRSGSSPGVRGPSSSNGFALSQAPPTRPVLLDSGLKPNTISNDFMEPASQECVTMHFSSALIEIPTASAERLYRYFSNVISFDLQTKAQAAVSFNVDLSKFSSTEILSAMNALLKSLQVYFFYQSIMVYYHSPSNKNQAMIALRKSITPSMLSDLNILGRRLADTPVPPKFYELIRYLSGTYSSGLSQASPLLKICPHELNGTDLILPTALSDCLADLNTPAINAVFTLLRRAVPQWSPKTLDPAPAETLFDLNYLTIFANLPFTFEDAFGGIAEGPTVLTNEEPIKYNSYTNELDGVAFCLTGMYNQSTNTWTPGLIRPVPYAPTTSLTGESRRSYYTVSGVPGFYPPTTIPYIGRSRQETYYIKDDQTPGAVHLFGSEKCLNVNSTAISQTSERALDYLMSAETITPSKRTGFNSNSSRSSSKGGGKKKSFKPKGMKSKPKNGMMSDDDSK